VCSVHFFLTQGAQTRRTFLCSAGLLELLSARCTATPLASTYLGSHRNQLRVCSSWSLTVCYLSASEYSLEAI